MCSCVCICLNLNRCLFANLCTVLAHVCLCVCGVGVGCGYLCACVVDMSMPCITTSYLVDLMGAYVCECVYPKMCQHVRFL